jgi:lipoprotein-anchoring transpeptidase ErfK/SrfK
VFGLLWLLGVLAANATGAPAATQPLHVHPGVPRSQAVAALVFRHAAREKPRRSSTRLVVVARRRPITNEQTVLPVVGYATAPNGRRWLRVRLPGRPNGHTGWIERAGTTERRTDWHIVVDLSIREAIVYRRGLAVRTFAVVVGKPSTPTPRGRYFVEESIQLTAGQVGGPYALALSARSNVFQEFEGGPGQIALHGLAYVGGVPGTAVSHGCVRLDAAAITWLVDRIAPGDPVTIKA